jgi:hypothetical protein
VNTHAEYRRHAYRPPEQTAATQGTEAEVNQLAHHRDPSLTSGREGQAAAKRGIAWVRPTELATYAAPWVGRGIDLHAELTRRARRAPVTATRSLHRREPATPAARPSLSQEGLGL